MPKPEDKARRKIDKQLSACGWTVTRKKSAWKEGEAVAIREWTFPDGTRVDYLLCYQGKAIAVVEAKKAEFLLGGVYHQSDGYLDSSAAETRIPKWRDKLCFTYIANGEVVQFADRRTLDSRSRVVFCFHRPETLKAWIAEGESTQPDRIRKYAGSDLPESLHLHDCQKQAIRGLEETFATQHRRAYVHLATGAGKTYAACTLCHRLLRLARARRILFLVDRTNLGDGALSEFSRWTSPESGHKFIEEYVVQLLQCSSPPRGAKVVISTIQRVYSMLSGIPLAPEDEEESAWERERTDEPEKKVLYNSKIPPEFFDFIIVDECHRSIYNKWRGVLEYFDATLIGLTATPTPQVHAFFAGNRVARYTYAESVTHGVNVPYTIFRIKTRISEQGGVIRPDAEFGNYRKNQYTGQLEDIELDKEEEYQKQELNRRVESPDQIRLILETYRDSIYTKLYPQRRSDNQEYDINFIPKTLIFAQTDAHAEAICNIAKDVFGRGDEFCQKITCTVTGTTSQSLIREFRTDPAFRIAVTVDLVATGTDIRALEVLLFMRDVRSNIYYEQMVGRGCRVIEDSMLRNVTPNATSKDLFYLVDAVGVTEHVKVTPQPTLRGGRHAALVDLMECVADWRNEEPDVDDVRRLAHRLTRLVGKCRRLYYIKELSSIHFTLPDVLSDDNGSMLAADPDDLKEDSFGLDGMAERLFKCAGNEHWDDAAHLLFDGFTPIMRNRISNLLRLRGILLTHELDVLEEAPDFTRNEAELRTKAFEEFLEANKNKYAALRFIYQGTTKQEPLLASQLIELMHGMAQADSLFKPGILWRYYQVLHPEQCREPFGKAAVEGNLISLVRYAAHLVATLDDFGRLARRNYELWLGRKIKAGIIFSDSQRAVLDMVRDAVILQFAGDIQRMKTVDPTLYPKCFKEKVHTFIPELTLALIA